MYLTYGAHERELEAAAAITLGLETAAAQGFTVNLRSIGDNIKTTICEFVDKNAGVGVASIGMGKGIGRQSMASAIFEAHEHLFSIGKISSCGLKLLKLDINGRDSLLIESCPDLHSIIGNHPSLFSRTEYTEFNNSSEILDYPYFLTNPYFEPVDKLEVKVLKSFSLRRYSTNSGTASGTNKSEALLHGLLEVVERDSIGIALLATILKKEPIPVKKYKYDLLTPNLQLLFNNVKVETGGDLHVWDISSDIGLPTALAALTVGGMQGSRYFGSGASLSPSYAIERAVLESVQYYQLHLLNGKVKPRSGAQMQTNLPTYVQCFLEAGFFGYRGGTVLANHAKIWDAESDATQTPDKQLSLIVGKLKACGFKSYWRSLSDGPVVVMQVVVPRLERFHLVARGVPVAPGPRGRSILGSV
ncbi:YcaO-like family protein [Pseudomonas veronii]|uniref:YcaO-like family protein n=1 Tax=Pseudomonas veronii TaxID=76761 RepID=UPI0026589DF1|nr:YcaO-like family protein [Pseudomonas veronii]WKC46929.1 YcaO-like family protein [Pseudomonas veronii]